MLRVNFVGDGQPGIERRRIDVEYHVTIISRDDTRFNRSVNTTGTEIKSETVDGCTQSFEHTLGLANVLHL